MILLTSEFKVNSAIKQAFSGNNNPFSISYWHVSYNFRKKTLSIFGPASSRSYIIGVVSNNWLVGWLVCRLVMQFSQKRLQGFFWFFYMKLGNYKGSKVIEPDFWKQFLIWRYSRRGLQISPKSDNLIFFSKTAPTIFLVFDLKIVNLNLSETSFSEKLAISRYLISKSSKTCPNWGF